MWTAWSLSGVLAGLGALALAVTLYRVAPQSLQARRLALYLSLIGINVVFGLYGLARSASSEAAYYGLIQIMAVSSALFVPAYLLFLGTLPTRWSVPFRTPAFEYALWIAGGLVALAFVLVPGAGPVALSGTEGSWTPVPSRLMIGLQAFITVVHLYAVIVAVSAFRRTQPGPARNQFRSYLIAFSVYDAALIGYTAFTLSPVWATQVAWVRAVDALLIPFGLAWLAGWTAYGILRNRLFDIDLKIKMGISRTTVATIIAGAAFVGSELIEQAFNVNQVVPAILIAAVVSLAFKPLVRFGDAWAGRLMPGVEDSEEYHLVRKLNVYRAAFESALEDGEVSTKEQSILETLASSLGLSAADVTRIRREAVS